MVLSGATNAMGKVTKRFLFDEDSSVKELEMKLFKPKTGSGTLREDTQAHLPA